MEGPLPSLWEPQNPAKWAGDYSGPTSAPSQYIYIFQTVKIFCMYTSIQSMLRKVSWKIDVFLWFVWKTQKKYLVKSLNLAPNFIFYRTHGKSIFRETTLYGQGLYTIFLVGFFIYFKCV
jgi:hypothetical protein